MYKSSKDSNDKFDVYISSNKDDLTVKGRTFITTGIESESKVVKIIFVALNDTIEGMIHWEVLS